MAEGDVVTGAAEVIDADILKIGQQRVILWGIDAPERAQTCRRDGEHWGCYDAARRTLELLAGRGEVTCYLRGEADPFGRRHGVCESGGEDLAAEMVRKGMALAFADQTEEYAPVQIEAIAAEAGLWNIGVEFREPWEFRRTNTPGGYR
jgi:endonuclease YncB( thermonuclease family)